MSNVDVLLIGIDAGCLPVFERLYEDDVIPNIRSICDGGASAPLESQMPPWTPSAWPSMYTGVNPGKHGVCGFVAYDGYDFHVVSGQDVEEHSIWSLLDQHDLTSVVVNVPVTHPPDDINGALIPGFIGPENPRCSPDGLLDDIREEIGEYRVYPTYSREESDYTDAQKMDEYTSLVRMRGEAFRYLADEYEPDFGFVQFQKPDTVFHEFDGDWDKVKTVYEETDRQVGKLLEECDPNTVFIASDHGMGPYEKYEFRVNEFLRDEGYVKARNGGRGMPSWNPIQDELREGKDTKTWEPNTFERLAAKVAQFGFTAHRIRTGLEKVGLAEIAKQYAPKNVARMANEQVDFAKSTAYVRARTELGVRINLQGREPNGIVPPEKYDEVRDELIEKLSGVETPDGELVFGEVVPRENYFHGKNADNAPDIVTIPNQMGQFISAQLLGDYFAPPTEPWNHKLEGIVAAKGEGIDVDAMPTKAHLFDIAPTVMSALGVPYSDRMDGTVIPVVEDAGSQSYPEYDEENDGTMGDDEANVEERLADLGYMQ
ncbi:MULTISPECIES: alkaline phosphatase family protein [unclassified Haladaptatus]|uniref:alkaline phosphatase family protein n=1 Tax=unclassified Haladaptatus TaxID=2622732 RepID=UPI00209BEBEE|nr:MULTISPECIES: alkaline phosphatase family protein [unclassified Haladaptatus]MCO8246903.1 alkaline phosphatase family protein [Haladaptatus sp. AB643]MCO8253571.1 alkaline phosphatase family protein [Haladaptatus sp. AB618]